MLDKTHKIDVLDHGFVRYVDHMGSDLSISRAARVSYDAPERTEDDNLIGYLIRNKHTSPFESVVFTFEVKAPIFVFRQWHRHRTWSFNEVSARYSKLPEEFYIPEVKNVGVQSKDNKQMRIMGVDSGLDDYAVKYIKDLQLHSEQGFKYYNECLGTGVPRELARLFLGLNVYSRMFATVDLHNLIHFIRLRLHEHAQYEIRVYAQTLLEMIETHVPITIKHFKASL